MEFRISSAELAHSLGDILERVSERGDSFAIERDGTMFARVVPAPERMMTLREFFTAWRGAMGAPDPEFADVLEAVSRADYPPGGHWAS